MKEARPTLRRIWRAAGKNGAVKGRSCASQRQIVAFCILLSWRKRGCVLYIRAMTFMHRFSAAGIFGLALVLTGCAGSGDRYPSLAQRDTERVSGTIGVAAASQTSPTAPAPIAPDADVTTRLAGLVERAQTAHSQFLAGIGPAERQLAAANGKTDDDNAWAEAQVAMADLDSLRSLTALALGDLDLMFADASTAFDRRDEIGAAQSQVALFIDQEDRELARLRQLMPK